MVYGDDSCWWVVPEKEEASPRERVSDDWSLCKGSGSTYFYIHSNLVQNDESKYGVERDNIMSDNRLCGSEGKRALRPEKVRHAMLHMTGRLFMGESDRAPDGV